MSWLRRDAADHDRSKAETESFLLRYAQDSLAMTDLQRARLRAATLTAFAAQPGRAAVVAVRRSPRGLILVLALVGLLALAGSVAAAESGPGQPFYGLRLGLERLTLPSEASARTDALLVLLERRLAEADQATAQGDAGAVADAVRAYIETLDEISGGIGEGASATAIQAGLQRHIDVLNRILGSAPSAAQEGLQRALQQAEHAKQALTHRPADPGPPALPSQAAQPSAAVLPTEAVQPSVPAPAQTVPALP
jgi:hypothetical protein